MSADEFTKMGENSENRGFLYIGTDEEYIRQAKQSAQIVKQNTNHSVAIVSDRNISSQVFDEVIIDENPRRSFADKPRNLSRTPFERTIYVDTDVYILETCDELFEMLENVDVATAIDPNEFELRIEGKNPHDIPESFPIYQTGVIAYRMNKKTRKFLDHWEEKHSSAEIDRDQLSFRTALYEQPVELNFSALSSNYNFLVGSPMRANDQVKLIHDTKSDLHSTSEIRNYARRLNKDTGQRLVYAYANKICSPISPAKNVLLFVVSLLLTTTDLIKYFIASLRADSTEDTINKVKRFIKNEN